MGAKKEAPAIGGGNRLKGGFGGQEQLLVGAGSAAAKHLFDLAPHRLDGIEIRRVGRQIQKPCAPRIDCFAHAPDLVGGEIVQDNHVTGSQSGSQALLHPSQKHLAIHGAFKQPRSARTIHADAGDQSAGLVVSQGDVSHQSLPSAGPATQARHLGVGPAFIHEN